MVRRDLMPDKKLDHARIMRKNPTEAENRLWEMLRRKSLGVRVKRQHPMWGYIADFYIASAGICVEVDGGYHQQRTGVDEARDAALKRHGITTVRFSNERVFDDPNGIICELKNMINCHT